MAVVANQFFFPLLQIVVVSFFAFAIYQDHFRPPSPGIPVLIRRGDESMKRLEKATGLVLALVITIINKGVFDAEPVWKAYSAFFNLLDVAAILYACYFSSWGRNRIFSLLERLRTD